MRTMIASKAWLTICCLGVAFSVGTACSDDDSEDNPDRLRLDAGDMFDRTDAADAPEQGDIAETDGSFNTGDATNAEVQLTGCDVKGIGTPDGLQVRGNSVDDTWTLREVFNTQYIDLTIARGGSIDGVGSFDFANRATSGDAYLMLGNGCNLEGCKTYYYAVSGTLEISKFDRNAKGAFEGTLRNVKLNELDSAAGQPKQNGKGWCVTSLEVKASVP